MVAPSRLLSVPVELLAHIIFLLHETPRDVLACQLTCRKLFHVVRSSVILQYVLRAKRAGVVDPLLPGMSAHERMRALSHWEMPWLLPDLRQPAYSMPQPWVDDPEPPASNRAPEEPKYFMQRGRLISVMSYSPFKYAVLDLRVPLSSLSNSWSVVTIPAFHDDEEYEAECFFQGYEFSFDSDLLVLTHLLDSEEINIRGGEVEIKLFNISRGEPHASAPIHTFNIPADDVRGDHVTVATAVVRDCILVNIVSDPRPVSQSHAVDWREGLVSKGRIDNDGNINSPCFETLAEDKMMFFRLDWNAIEIGTRRQLGDLDLGHDAESFSLPAISHGAFVGTLTSAMEAWSWTLPDWESAPATEHAPGRIPFHTPPENRLITFNATYFDAHCLTFVIPCTNLLALMKHDFSAVDTYDDDPHIPWEEWGPRYAHVVDTDSIFYGKAVGQRWFFADDEGIGFRDFHPFRVSQAARWFGRAPNGCTVKAVWGPVTVMPREGCLEEDIVSALPYMEIRLPIPLDDLQSTMGIAVDDERLVHVFDKEIEGDKVQRWMNIYLLA